MFVSLTGVLTEGPLDLMGVVWVRLPNWRKTSQKQVFIFYSYSLKAFISRACTQRISAELWPRILHGSKREIQSVIKWMWWISGAIERFGLPSSCQCNSFTSQTSECKSSLHLRGTKHECLPVFFLSWEVKFCFHPLPLSQGDTTASTRSCKEAGCRIQTRQRETKHEVHVVQFFQTDHWNVTKSIYSSTVCLQTLLVLFSSISINPLHLSDTLS